MDGVTILNKIEIVQAVNDTFNHGAAFIAIILTVFICAVVGLIIGGQDWEEELGACAGALIGLILCIFTGPAFGAICADPPEIETTVRYEVIIDDSVSLTEFCEHYNIIEQRGEILVVEEKLPE